MAIAGQTGDVSDRISDRIKAVLVLAQKIAREIELDILSGNYDRTKEKYKATEVRKSVLELWDGFTIARGMQGDAKYKSVRSHPLA